MYRSPFTSSVTNAKFHYTILFFAFSYDDDNSIERSLIYPFILLFGAAELN